jgi:hypothetical protein
MLGIGTFGHPDHPNHKPTKITQSLPVLQFGLAGAFEQKLTVSPSLIPLVQDVKEDDEARLSPLSHKHVNMLGHYSFTLAEQVLNGQLRPWKRPSAPDEWP